MVKELVKIALSKNTLEKLVIWESSMVVMVILSKKNRGTYSFENLKVMADLGFTEMNTDTDLHTAYGTLSSNNTKSYTFTTGVNAKYSFALDYVDVAPHAGIRFNHANIDKYKVKRQGEVMMTGDSISQNYFQFPVGVEV